MMVAMCKVEGFPSRGWREDLVEDLGKDPADHVLCEYCGQEYVRYLHRLLPPQDTRWLAVEVGCVCAGKLTGRPEKAAQMDRAARNISARRANWCGLKGWRIGRKGGLVLKKDGRIFALNSSKYGSFAGSWTGRGDEVWKRADGWHRDLDAAKLALFDAVYGPQEPEDEVAA